MRCGANALLLVGCLGLGLLGGPGVAIADDEEIFVISMMILTVEGEGSPLFAIDIDDEEMDANTVQVGGTVIDLRGPMPLFDGEEEPSPASGVEILAMPRVATHEGEQAMVRSGHTIEYVERAENGCLEIRVLQPPDQEPGLVAKFTVHRKAAKPGENLTVDLDFFLDLVTISGRLALSGTSLDIGKPMLMTQSVQRRLELPLGQWKIALGHHLFGDSKRLPMLQVLVFVKVELT